MKNLLTDIEGIAVGLILFHWFWSESRQRPPS